MTLMETVIALGMIAFTVPLILAGTRASLEDRRNAEADTRAAWLVKDVQRQIAAVWATPARETDLPASLDFSFPAFGSSSDPIVLIYDNSGGLIGTGSSADLKSGCKASGARYLVTAYSKIQTPANLFTSPPDLSRLYFQVHHPAKAPLTKRQVIQFSVVTPKQAPF